MRISQKVDKETMHQSNLKLIFYQIYENKQVTRPQLARLTGISIMAVGRLAEELVKWGLVTEEESVEGAAVGRPARLLRVASEKLAVGGIYLDRNGIRAGVVDPYGKILGMTGQPFPAHAQSPEDTLADAVALLQQVCADRSLPMPEAVGLVCPGLISWETGVVRFSSQLKWKDVGALELLQKLLPGTKIAVDNDIKALALAESRFGAACGYNSCVLLNLGSGIGAAAVIDGVIYRGKDNDAGEIGHISINAGGRMCECGRIGCLQTNIADWAILQEARTVRPGISLPEVFAAYRSGESWAQVLLGRASGYISMAISLLANVYAPEAIVLCGSLIDDFPEFRALSMQDFRHQRSDMLAANFDLAISRFGADGPVIGATSIAFSRLVNQTVDAGKDRVLC